jgi:hypothetical protein
LEDSTGKTLLLVNPSTGAVLVGENDADLPTTAGVRVVGSSVRGTQQDSDNWAATKDNKFNRIKFNRIKFNIKFK